jgi:hypothetical protein
MTNRALRRRLYLTAFVVVLCLSLSAVEYFHNRLQGPTFVSRNATLFAVLFAAYIAYLFQQRSKLVDDLRRWWMEIVQAKSEFFLYCDKENPTEEDYLKAFYKISTAMDTLRLIYCNVDRTSDNPRGYYPFEQVRDIVDIARSVAPGRDASPESRKRAKAAIDYIFQSLRHAIQSEASAAPPDNPTLYESENRSEYLEEVLRRSNVKVEHIRRNNKRALTL